MINVRHWSSRHARFFEGLYDRLELVLVALHPFFLRIGYKRLEKPASAIEKTIKGFLFETQMCGSCTLSATGMVCPMNCPKKMRNGPCGGVRANGHCEIKPEMPCVWSEAYAGSRLMKQGDRIFNIQAAVDHRLENSSTWLREVRRKVGVEAKGNDLQ